MRNKVNERVYKTNFGWTVKGLPYLFKFKFQAKRLAKTMYK